MKQGPDLSALIAGAAEVWACLTSYLYSLNAKRDLRGRTVENAVRITESWGWKAGDCLVLPSS